VSLSWIEDVRPCLRRVGEKDRIYPKAKRVEVVFLMEAENYLLLRTEGQGYINAAILPESKLEVPVALPEKLQAVSRRMMLQLLRDYRDSAPDKVREFVERAASLGFVKAEEHLKTGWNCTIQPPIAGSGDKATDLGMDGYCPACALFGAALTEREVRIISGQLSIGVKTRVHFDPAFATRRGIVPATHNKVTEGLLSTTGQALYPEAHVEPGTVFVGRVVLTEVTEPELLAFLYTLAHVEEIGGRSGVYGTVRMHLLGIRCGRHSATTALTLAEEVVSEGKTGINAVKEYVSSILEKLGFKPLSSEEILKNLEHTKPDGLFYRLWQSTLDYDEQWVNWVKELGKEESSGGRGRGRGKKA
jgi:CRISPR type I-D-associated protein Csc2